MKNCRVHPTHWLISTQVVHKEHLRLKDTALDLEERLHRHEVRERCVALEALWKDYEEATISA